VVSISACVLLVVSIISFFSFLCFVSVSVCCSIWVLCLKIKIYIHTYIIIIIRAALSVGIVPKVALLSLACSRLYCGSDSLVPVCDTRAPRASSCVVKRQMCAIRHAGAANNVRHGVTRDNVTSHVCVRT